MKIAAPIAALLTLVLCGAAASQTPDAANQRLVCLSLGEARDLFLADGLVPPSRIMRDAAQIAQAEAIDIQLCRAHGILVYDVTLLDEDGRVMHKLLGASDGVLLSERNNNPAAGPQPNDGPGTQPVDRAIDPRAPQQRGN